MTIRRLLRMRDADVVRYPIGSRIVDVAFEADRDEREVARAFAAVSEVVWAQPDYIADGRAFSFPPDDPLFAAQWSLGPAPDSLENCLSNSGDPTCCDDCDLGVETAWQWARGDTSVIVAFLDQGADMQHPDLFESDWVNPGEGLDGDGIAELCPTSQGGDLDTLDTDDDGVVDNLMGWNIEQPDSSQIAWRMPPTWHGTSVAGVLGARSDNGIGVASVAGGTASNRGVRVMQFAAPAGTGPWITSRIYQTFYLAELHDARIYSTSSRIGVGVDSLLAIGVSELQDSLLFVQAAGNDGANPITSAFARLPGVMRWVGTTAPGPGG